jgi:hypothetical protein
MLIRLLLVKCTQRRGGVEADELVPEAAA